MFIQLIKFTKRKHTQIPTKLLDQQHNFYDMLYLKTFEIYPHFVTRGEKWCACPFLAIILCGSSGDYYLSIGHEKIGENGYFHF